MRYHNAVEITNVEKVSILILNRSNIYDVFIITTYIMLTYIAIPIIKIDAWYFIITKFEDIIIFIKSIVMLLIIIQCLPQLSFTQSLPY